MVPTPPPVVYPHNNGSTQCVAVHLLVPLTLRTRPFGAQNPAMHLRDTSTLVMLLAGEGTRRTPADVANTQEQPGCAMAVSMPHGIEGGAGKKRPRMHSEDRPFRCPEPGCSSAFRTRGVLVAHGRTHCNDRPFVCFCGAAFKTKGVLVAHGRCHTRPPIAPLLPASTSITLVNVAAEGSLRQCGICVSSFAPDGAELDSVAIVHRERLVVYARCRGRRTASLSACVRRLLCSLASHPPANDVHGQAQRALASCRSVPCATLKLLAQARPQQVHALVLNVLRSLDK